MVRMSEKIDQIAGALNQLQAMNLAVEKTETNPHFKSKFANLEGHWEMLRQPMTRLGLSVVQLPSTILDKPALTTIIMHASGQFIEATALMVISANDPQKQVAAITYMRRAALSGAMGTVAVEDDDGNLAAGKTPHALPSDPGKYIIPFGKKYKGKTISEIGLTNAESYASWLEDDAKKKRVPLEGDAKVFVAMVDALLQTGSDHSNGSGLSEPWDHDLPINA
jgi:hypothetical protein